MAILKEVLAFFIGTLHYVSETLEIGLGMKTLDTVWHESKAKRIPHFFRSATLHHFISLYFSAFII